MYLYIHTYVGTRHSTARRYIRTGVLAIEKIKNMEDHFRPGFQFEMLNNYIRFCGTDLVFSPDQ